VVIRRDCRDQFGNGVCKGFGTDLLQSIRIKRHRCKATLLSECGLGVAARDLFLTIRIYSVPDFI
jgi:hypothetical protein